MRPEAKGYKVLKKEMYRGRDGKTYYRLVGWVNCDDHYSVKINIPCNSSGMPMLSPNKDKKEGYFFEAAYWTGGPQERKKI